MAESKKSNRGGAREGAGRPQGASTSDEKRTRNIGIRLTESELALLKEKAAQASMSTTAFIISLIQKA